MSLPEAFESLVWDIVFDIALELFARRVSSRLLSQLQLFGFGHQETETVPETSISEQSHSTTSTFSALMWAIGAASLLSEPLETLGARVIPHILDTNTTDGEELLYFLTAAITL
ncbi:hypothetical protein TWF481_000198 [Arthrobotrys musiformis]|uniref:Uncharacterized protein n=1 Tax=Arthrobotrys musiformis TaxID=47236 RepID=A0AAV9WN07_9PEZI